jgi:hypothetical protein
MAGDSVQVSNPSAFRGLAGYLALILPLAECLTALVKAELAQFYLRVHHTVIHLPPPDSTTFA